MAVDQEQQAIASLEATVVEPGERRGALTPELVAFLIRRLRALRDAAVARLTAVEQRAAELEQRVAAAEARLTLAEAELAEHETRLAALELPPPA